MLQKTKDQKRLFWWVVFAFTIIPLVASSISALHVFDFFALANYNGIAVTLAVTFELGALAALAGLLVLDKINKNVIWFIFITLFLYQCMGNTYSAYDSISKNMGLAPTLIKNWTELFGLDETEIVIVKRTLSIIEGAFLPVISLSFLHLLINYVQKETTEGANDEKKTDIITDGINKVERAVEGTVEGTTDGTTEGTTDGTTDTVNDTINDTVNDTVNNTAIEKKTEDDITSHIDQQEDFKEFLKEKKKRIEGMREPNLELLEQLYDNGKIKAGQELVGYTEFINRIDNVKHNQKEINLFLTLCNYLDICNLSGTKRIALKNYEDAKQILSNYLTIGEQEEPQKAAVGQPPSNPWVGNKTSKNYLSNK